MKIALRIKTYERSPESKKYIQRQVSLVSLCKISFVCGLCSKHWSSVKPSTRSRKESRKPCFLMTLNYDTSFMEVACKRGVSRNTVKNHQRWSKSKGVARICTRCIEAEVRGEGIYGTQLTSTSMTRILESALNRISYDSRTDTGSLYQTRLQVQGKWMCLKPA
jgi:transposase-like protein